MLPGTKLGPYEIQSALGAGGMGEVYRARDTRLNRTVAVKVLPQHLAGREAARERFDREARAISSLNHPNICQLYDVGEQDGTSYLVMECLEGGTLAEQLRKGPLPLDHLLRFAIEIADALDTAHRQGIIHRDLKPGNIFVTAHGECKVLDFGLAKLGDDLATPEAQTLSAPEVLTSPGTAVGTVAYMSPEQARGEPLDARTDIFSLGAVLYEMATGKLAFPGKTSAVIFNAILERSPVPPFQLNPVVPVKLDEIILKALEKEPDLRYQSAADLRGDLKRLARGASSEKIQVAAKPGRSSKRNMRWAFAVSLLLPAAIVAVVWLSSSPRLPRVLATTQLTHDGVSKCCPVSDGSRVYLVERDHTEQIFQVSARGGDTTLIPTPFARTDLLGISPDRTQLLGGSRVGTELEMPLASLPLPQGSPRHLADAVGDVGAWSPDGQHLIFSKISDLYLANADGSDPHKIATVSGAPSSAVFSPDGRRIRLTVARSGRDSLWEMRSDGTGLHPLFPAGQAPHEACCGQWTPDGKHYFFVSESVSGNNVWALPEPGGLFHWQSALPIQMTTGPLSFQGVTVSPNGTTVLVNGSQGRAELVRYDTKSGQFVPFLGGISAGELDFSRDGKWITYAAYPDATIWRSRTDGSDRLQLTFPPTVAGLPRWSPDGKQIAFAGARPGAPWKVFVVSAAGGTPQEAFPETIPSEQGECDPAWSPDGKKLAFGPRFQVESPGIRLVDLATRQVSIIPGSESLFSPRWSPDGQYLAALTGDSAKLMLFNFASRNWSTWVAEPGEVGFPNWSSDSKYLYYDTILSEQSTFRRIRVGQTNSEFVADLKGLHRYFSEPAFGWAGVAPDGSSIFARDLSTNEIYALDLDLP